LADTASGSVYDFSKLVKASLTLTASYDMSESYDDWLKTSPFDRVYFKPGNGGECSVTLKEDQDVRNMVVTIVQNSGNQIANAIGPDANRKYNFTGLNPNGNASLVFTYEFNGYKYTLTYSMSGNADASFVSISAQPII